jgi:hypothetical protein
MTKIGADAYKLQWKLIDIDSALGVFFLVDVSNDADISKAQVASIFMAEVPTPEDGGTRCQ